MFFNAKLGCSVYGYVLVIFTCLSVSSYPQRDNNLKNSFRNCNSTLTTVSANLTKRNCSSSSTNATNMTNGTGKKHSIDDNHEDKYYIINIANMTVVSTGVLCNLLLIIIIMVDPLKILRRGAWITILNLAVADFIACTGVFFELFFIQMEDNETVVLVWEKAVFFRMFGQSASFLLLTLLTVEIYLIIKYPMESRLMLTTKKSVMSCAFMWVLATVLGLSEISLVWTEEFHLYFYIANIGVLELVVVVQVVLKVLIAFEMFNSRRSMLNIEKFNQKQYNVAKTVMILNVILIITAFPYFLAKQIEYVKRLGQSNDALLREIDFSYYYEPIALLNYVLNPILYSLRLQDYRRSLFALLKCKCDKRHRSNSSTSQQRYISTPEKTETSQMTKL